MANNRLGEHWVEYLNRSPEETNHLGYDETIKFYLNKYGYDYTLKELEKFKNEIYWELHTINEYINRRKKEELLCLWIDE